MSRYLVVVGILALFCGYVFFLSSMRGKNLSTLFKTPVVWGAYTGNTDQSMATFESFVGGHMSIDAVFWGWDSDFPTTTAGTLGKTLVIFWEPSFGFDQINNGSKDEYIIKFADAAKRYGFPIILAPFDEFNLNESAWGNGRGTNTPPGFIAAWKRVHAVFTTRNVTNVEFALVYNNISTPAQAYRDFYPGDAYVDYVGVDGFNFGGQTFAQVFDTALGEAAAFKKPVWIYSTGSVNPKVEFIKSLGQSGYQWIWFNESPFEIDSGSGEAFKSIL